MTTRFGDTPGSKKTPPTLVHRGLADARAGGEVNLDAAEAAHARTARLRAGDVVTLTDGRGARWEAEFAALERRSARCRLLKERSPEPAPAVALWIPVANRDRTLWLVEKSVELGVRALRWIEWERSRSVADAARSDAFRARARTRAEAALKQSGGSWVPEMFDVIGLEEALALECAPNESRWLADARGESALEVATRLRSSIAVQSPRVTVLVGPEGGFTSQEAEACQAAGFRVVAYGLNTLRFETAAIGILGLAVSALARARAS